MLLVQIDAHHDIRSALHDATDLIHSYVFCNSIEKEPIKKKKKYIPNKRTRNFKTLLLAILSLPTTTHIIPSTTSYIQRRALHSNTAPDSKKEQTHQIFKDALTSYTLLAHHHTRHRLHHLLH